MGEAVPYGLPPSPPALAKSVIVGVTAERGSSGFEAEGGPNDGGLGIESDSGLFGRRCCPPLLPALPPTGDDVPDEGTLAEPLPPLEQAWALGRPGKVAANGTACDVLGSVAAGEQATESGVTAQEGVEVESEQTL